MHNARVTEDGKTAGLHIDRATDRMFEGFRAIMRNYHCRVAMGMGLCASMTIKQITYTVRQTFDHNGHHYELAMFFVDAGGVPECFAAKAIFDESDV